MTRNMFGWDLPPGVTTSMLPGNEPEQESQEALYDSFYEKMTEAARETVGRGNVGLDEEAMEKMAGWFSDQIGGAYAKGQQEGSADEAMAHECLTGGMIRDLAACPLSPQHDAAEDDQSLFGIDGWHLTVGHVRAARRSLPHYQGPDGELP